MSNELPKDASQQIDWLTDYINKQLADPTSTVKPEVIAGMVFKLVDMRIKLTRLNNGLPDDSDFAALQAELGG